MKIQPIQIYSNNISQKPVISPTFEGGGKPITLQYIVKNRSNLLPERILTKVKQLLKECPAGELPSLMEVHKSTYAPLLTCKSLDEAKELFPEFADMDSVVMFERNSVYAKEFYERTDEKFALKMLQDFWANLKTKEEIAQELGMTSRSTLEWPLKQIGFVSYPSNYKTLLRASDKEENKIIAAKTTAWNAAHPDLMYARNKHAAQSCKTAKYRAAQSRHIKEYDLINPERKEKISESLRIAWQKCPEIRKAMSDFAGREVGSRKALLQKLIELKIPNAEIIVEKDFFKKFWSAHPELRAVYSEARTTAKKPL